MAGKMKIGRKKGNGKRRHYFVLATFNFISQEEEIENTGSLTSNL
jgi:hypothetical protein